MSGKATALAEAKKLKQVMAKHGVQCSIELQVGRPWSGDDWYSRKHVLVNHHTAGAKTGNTPSLALVKRGRGADLPGPLCNGYGGRDHIYRVICMGLANHPGAGGPLTVAGFTLPKDSARISGWGTEWEHDGVSAWPTAMQEFMGRSNAALCEYLDISASRSIEHKTWAPGRKVDRNRYTAETGQQEIKTWSGKTVTAPKPATVPAKPKEDDVKLTDEIKVSLYTTRVYDPKATKPTTRTVEETLLYPAGVERLRAEMHAAQRQQGERIEQLAGAITKLATSMQALSEALAPSASAPTAPTQ